MEKKSKKKAAAVQNLNRKRVVFSVDAPDAKEVLLMGDFNKWDPKAHPMKKIGNGIWTKTIMVPPGKYEYKFLVDGNWKQDPGNQQSCTNPFGTLNSILDLK